MTDVICKIQLNFRYKPEFNITHIVFIELLHLFLSPIRFRRKVFKLHLFLGMIK
jgi:hypothetical protein